MEFSYGLPWRRDWYRGARIMADFAFPLIYAKVWDDLTQDLPATPADDDLGLIPGVFGTSAPKISTGNVGSSGCTRFFRFQKAVPVDFNTTASVTVKAGMEGATADGSAKVDVEVYRTEDPAVDICSTGEQDMNALTAAEKTFNLDASGLSDGQLIDVRVKIEIVDSAGSNVNGIISDKVGFSFA